MAPQQRDTCHGKGGPFFVFFKAPHSRSSALKIALKIPERSYLGSHPTIGVALLAPKKGIPSDQLSSSSEELPFRQ